MTCGICNGYFNFAHTLVDCGHTFCRMCIYNHFKKSKVPKCPVCGEMIEKNFTKSVRRDPYKQSLVDLIHPEYHEQDLQIIKRCRLLFPDFDIQTIKDELDSSSWDFYPKKKRKQILESKLKHNLNDTVSKVLGVTLDVFAKDILNDEKFNDMMQKKIEYDKNNTSQIAEETKQQDGSDLFISLYPKTPEDFNIVGLKNVLSVSKNKPVGIAQLKKFLFNHLVNKYKDKEPPYKGKAAIDGIILSLKDRPLENFEAVEDLKKKNGENSNLMIYYEISFKDQ